MGWKQWSGSLIAKQQSVEYLICAVGDFTAANLAQHLDQVSHDTIADFLQKERLTARSLWETVGKLMSNSSEAFLIVDDNVQDKRYSRFIERSGCSTAAQRTDLCAALAL